MAWVVSSTIYTVLAVSTGTSRSISMTEGEASTCNPIRWRMRQMTAKITAIDSATHTLAVPSMSFGPMKARLSCQCAMPARRYRRPGSKPGRLEPGRDDARLAYEPSCIMLVRRRIALIATPLVAGLAGIAKVKDCHATDNMVLPDVWAADLSANQICGQITVAALAGARAPGGRRGGEGFVRRRS